MASSPIEENVAGLGASGWCSIVDAAAADAEVAVLDEMDEE